MIEQYVITLQYTVLQEIEEIWPILNRQTIKHVIFLRKYKDKRLLCGHNIATEDVSVTQLSRNTEFSVWQTVCVTINRLFKNNKICNSTCCSECAQNFLHMSPFPCVLLWKIVNASCILQVLNPLDAVCNRQRTDAMCINQLKNAKHIDDGLLQERPDVKIFLPFRFLFYRPEEVFQPHSYNRYLGRLCLSLIYFPCQCTDYCSHVHFLNCCVGHIHTILTNLFCYFILVQPVNI